MMLRGEPLKTAKAAMVMLHGRGADADDILDLAKYLDAERIAYLAPSAPGNAWYPHTFLAPIEKNEPQLTESLAQVQRSLTMLEKAGIPQSRVFLLGFSQGACLASQFMAQNPRKYAGLFCLAGGLIGETLPDFKGDLEGTHAFFGCAEKDPYIPKLRVEESAKVFGSLGAQVTKMIYPGEAHTINDDELERINAIMAQVLGN